ncbi:Multicopper oxidase PfmaD [Frankliniella fusca]|uniref:Multicopper oxidase PfmaD n=1 Tax=Frankliniella fusca TaxID=407009 RepID=A0AAE1GTP8_9NEOP|nr:Multicopper oxidase PfmaD [Frankliniella fusca]
MSKGGERRRQSSPAYGSADSGTTLMGVMGARRSRHSARAPAALWLLAAVLLLLVAHAAPQKYGKPDPCYRECVSGETMVCKYDFHEEIYNALNAACGRCADGEFGDCFLEACVQVDGVERTVYSINRMLPGPAIHVCVGDTVIVDLHVLLPGHADTLHWHGLHQRDTPYMDGVSMVTQCPVLSGDIFRYQFVVDAPGTYFYHPHNGK